MNWHTKMIIRKVFALLICCLIMLLFLILFISSIDTEINSGVFLFALLTLFMGIIAFSQYKQLINAIGKKKEASAIDLRTSLQYINPYDSYDALSAAFDAQTNNVLYQDNRITITTSFIKSHRDNSIFIIDGVLDVVSFVQKVNGIVDYVSLIFLYYDGNRYEIKYKRSFGISNMEENASNINLAANIIANRSPNFRKHPAYRL